MVRIKGIGFIAAVLIIMYGCSAYQLASQKKSVMIDVTSPNIIKVTFCGNAYMTKKEVEKYALQRASIEALSKGCSHFVIVSKKDDSKVCALSFGKQLYGAAVKDSQDIARAKDIGMLDFVEPNITLSIRCVSKDEEIPRNAIDARQFLRENFPGMEKSP